jgi:CheY-like chemotaxis protein
MVPTLLIVDDQKSIRQRLAAAATTGGFRVVDQCADAAEAVASATEHHPDVVLMDVNLPGEMDGLDATRLILEMRPETLVVACSGFSNPDGMEQAFHVGVHRCLRKPIRMEEAHRLFECLHEELECRALIP